MKLYYSPGAASLAPHIALREAERSFELVRVDLHTKRLASGDDYRLINPKCKVPTLVLDGDVLTENPAVLLYVADLVPDKHLAPPGGTFTRYHMIEMLSFIATEVHKQFGLLWHPETPAPVQERQRGKIGEALLYLQDVLSDRAYLFGETFSVADCYMIPLLRWCERFGMSLPIWPNLDDYYQRMAERPTVAAALAAEGLLATPRMKRTA
jgi:glutathione S-transferase